jgi:F0F1-type ATP synthase membrane subunit b/b'
MNYDHTSNHQQWRDELNARRDQIESKLAEIDRAPANDWQDLGKEVDQEIAELSEVARSAVQQRTAGA